MCEKHSGTVTFGAYPFSSEGEIRPIEWIVLDKQDDQFLLVSKYCLDWRPFHVHSAVKWERSDIRWLLNYLFYEDAFSEEEKRFIVKRRIKTSDKICRETLLPDEGVETEDYVFLLSAWEADRYFPDDEARRTIATPYAQTRGAVMSSEYGAAGWWLRCRGYNVAYASDVLCSGQICLEGEEVYENGGIRPAIWVKF